MSDERTIEDLRAFAASRGGECLGEAYEGDDVLHGWRCAKGHTFEASPTRLVMGGYWCPECAPRFGHPEGWDYDAQSMVDPLLRAFHRQP